jgi:hypothetical protein
MRTSPSERLAQRLGGNIHYRSESRKPPSPALRARGSDFGSPGRDCATDAADAAPTRAERRLAAAVAAPTAHGRCTLAVHSGDSTLYLAYRMPGAMFANASPAPTSGSRSNALSLGQRWLSYPHGRLRVGGRRIRLDRYDHAPRTGVRCRWRSSPRRASCGRWSELPITGGDLPMASRLRHQRSRACIIGHPDRVLGMHPADGVETGSSQSTMTEERCELRSRRGLSL